MGFNSGFKGLNIYHTMKTYEWLLVQEFFTSELVGCLVYFMLRPLCLQGKSHRCLITMVKGEIFTYSGTRNPFNELLSHAVIK